MPPTGAWSHDGEIMIWAIIKRQMLNQLSHPGTPEIPIFKVLLLDIKKLLRLLLQLCTPLAPFPQTQFLLFMCHPHSIQHTACHAEPAQQDTILNYRVRVGTMKQTLIRENSEYVLLKLLICPLDQKQNNSRLIYLTQNITWTDIFRSE